ncbi:MAG: J domain-containing protein [bacterium]
MSGEPFLDYYELLQISPNADPDTIHRVFRHLAKKYHPDTPGTGNGDQFNVLLNGYRTLTDPQARAAYDIRHQQHWNSKWKLAAEAANARGFEDDAAVRRRLLSLLYVQRKRDVRSPGIGEGELSRLLGCPAEIMEFHVWYMREKGWILRTENGLFAISAEGVDRVEQDRVRLRPDRLIEAHAGLSAGDGDDGDKQVKEIADRSPFLKVAAE